MTEARLKKSKCSSAIFALFSIEFQGHSDESSLSIGRVTCFGRNGITKTESVYLNRMNVFLPIKAVAHCLNVQVVLEASIYSRARRSPSPRVPLSWSKEFRTAGSVKEPHRVRRILRRH